ncbi:Neuroblast differentiation-associated protein [Dermatophagoides farinae]|uniref:Neuroblast differentiation-associated protein n=1 Tax=Dermatophagoides farinae TaxID=6954 RepID=A0A922IG14_DERFA|nr:Neuroblast differentiation-associated protein [Dermatophagoides farinae]
MSNQQKLPGKMDDDEIITKTNETMKTTSVKTTTSRQITAEELARLPAGSYTISTGNSGGSDVGTTTTTPGITTITIEKQGDPFVLEQLNRNILQQQIDTHPSLTSSSLQQQASAIGAAAGTIESSSTSSRLPKMNEKIVIERAFDKPLTNQPQVIHQKTTITNITSGPLLMAKGDDDGGGGGGNVMIDTTSTRNGSDGPITTTQKITKTILDGSNVVTTTTTTTTTNGSDDPNLMKPEDFINPDLLTPEQAAIRIQAAFRGYEVRKSLSRDPSPNSMENAKNKKKQKTKPKLLKSIENKPPPVSSVDDKGRKLDDNLQMAIDNAAETVDQAIKDAETDGNFIDRLFGRKKRSLKKSNRPDVLRKKRDISMESDVNVNVNDDDNELKLNVHNGGGTGKNKRKKEKLAMTKRHQTLDRPPKKLQWEYKTGDINAENVVDIGKSKGVGLMKIGSKISPSETNILRIETKSYSVKDREGNVSGNFIIEQKTGDFDLRPSGDGSGGDGGKWPKMIESGDINARKHGKLDMEIQDPNLDVNGTTTDQTADRSKRGKSKDRVNVSVGKIKLGGEVIDLKITDDKTNKFDKFISARMSPEPEDMRVESGNIDVNVDGSFGLKDRFRRGKSKEKEPKSKKETKDFEITMPKIDLKGPKGEISSSGIDVNVGHVEVDAPKVEGDLDLSLKKKRGKSKEKDGKSWEFGMPKFGFKGPKVSGPDVDVNVDMPDVKLKAPKISGPEVDVKGPKISGADVDVNVDLPDGEIDLNISPKEKEGKDWQLKMPKFGIKGPKISGSDVDLKLEKPELDVKAPKVEGDIDLSIDGKKPEGKDWEFKMPKLGFKGPKISGPDIDIKGTSGKISGPEVNVEMPQVDVKMPELEGDVDVSLKGKKPVKDGKDWEIKMPKFGFKSPKVSGPDVDVNVELPEGEIDLNLSPKDKENKDWEFKMPKFGFKGPKVSGPDVNVNVEMPEVEIKGPKVEGDLDVELKGKSPEKDGKGWEFHMPKFGFKGPKTSGPEIDIKGPSGKISSPEMDVNVDLPEVDVKPPQVEGDINLSLKKKRAKSKEKDGKGWEFSMPKFGFKGPKVSGPDADVNVNVPEVDVNLPNVDLKAPNVEGDINLSIDGKKPESKDWEFKMPKFGFKGPKLSGPDVEVKAPKVSGPDVDLNVEMPDVKVKGPKVEGDIDLSIDGKKPEGKDWEFKMPKFGFKGPKVSGPKISGPNVDVKSPSGKVSGPEVNVELPDVKLKSPKVEGDIDLSIDGKKTEEKDWEIKMPKFGFKGPKISGSKVSGPDVDVNIEMPDVEIKKPKVEGDLDVSIDGKKLDKDSKGWDVKMPKFSIKVSGQDVDLKGPKFSGPDVDVELPDVKVKGPKVEGDIDLSIDGKKPEEGDLDVSIDGKKLDKDGKGWDLKMPKFGFKGPKISGPDVDLKGPKFSGPDVDVNVNVLDIDIKAPKVSGPDVDVNVELPDVKVKGPKVDIDLSIDGKKPEGKDWEFKMPKFGFKGPKISGPDVDVKGPSGTISGPEIEVDIPQMSAPKVEGDLDVSIDGKKLDKDGKGWDLKMPKFGFKGPKISGPDVDLKGPKFSGPEADVNVDLPDVNVKSPKVEGDIDLSIDGKKPDGKDWEFKMPKFGFKGPKISGPDVDLKAPKVSSPDMDVNVEMPQVDVKMPELEGDVNLTSGNEKSDKDSEGWKFKMPKFGFKGPKISGPDVDLKGPKVSGPDVDLNVELQDVNVKGPKISGPDVGIDVKMPEVEVDTSKIEGDINLSLKKKRGKSKEKDGKSWDFHMPKFGIKGPKVSSPDVDVNVEMPDVEFDLPKVEGDANLSLKKKRGKSKDRDTKSPEKDGKGWDFHMPKFSFKGPKVSGPDVDVNVDMPDADVELPKVEGDINLSLKKKRDKSREKDRETPEPKDSKDFEFHMPKFGFKGPKISGPDVDIKGPSGKLTGPEIDIDAPQMEVKMPEIQGDVDSSLKGKSPEKDGKGWDLKMPKFGFKGPKISGPDIDLKGPKVSGLDVDLEVPSGEIRGPEIEIDVPKMSAPKIESDIDLSIDGKKPEGKDWEFKMPKFGFKGPKISGPDVDLKAPKVSGPDVDVNVDLPDVKVKGPKVEGDIDLSVDGKKPEGKDWEFKMPKFGFKGPKISGPDVDVKGPSGKISGPEIEVDIPQMSAPKVEGDIDLSIDGKKPEGKDWEFKMPKFGFKGPKISGPDVDLKVSGRDVDVNVELPDVEVKGPKVEGKLDVSIDGKKDGKGWDFKMPKFGFKGPKLSGPDIDLKGPKVSGPDVDVNVNASDVDIKTPKVSGPDVDVKLPDVKLKGQKVSGPDVDVYVEMPQVDVKMPKLEGEVDLSINGKKLDKNSKGWDLKMPKFGFKGPKISGPDVDLKGPKVTGPDVDVNVDLPDVKVKSPKVEGDIDLSIDGKKTEGKDWEFKMPKFGFKGPKVSGPDVDVEMPDVNVKGPKVEGDLDVSIDGKKDGKGWELKMPKFGFKGPKISDPDVDLKGPKISGPDVDVNVDLPDVKVKGPKVEGDIDLSIDGKKPEGKDWEFKMPKFGFKGPKISGPDVDIKGASGKISSPEIKVDTPQMSAPKVEGDLDVSIDGKKLDKDGKGWDLKMPKFGFKGPKVSGPDVDVNVGIPDVNVKAPKVEGDLDVSIDGKKLDKDGKGWDLKMPKFGFKGPKISGPDVDLKGPKFSGPDVDVNVNVPDIDVKAPKVDAPDLDVNVELPDVKVKGPKVDIDLSIDGKKPEGKDWEFKMPKFGFKGPKISGPDVDVQGASGKISSPEIKVDIPQMSAPKVEGDLDVSIDGKKLDKDGKGWDLKMPKFGFKGPKISGPDVDLKGPKFSGPEADVNVDLPDVNVKSPKVDGDLDVTIDGKKDGKGWDFKMPKFGFIGPKISGPDVDLKAPEVSGPDVDVNVESSDIKLKGPKVEGEFDLSIDKKQDKEGKGWEFHMPKFGFKGHKISGPDVDVKGPSGKISGPEIEVVIPQMSAPKVEGDLDVSIDTKKPDKESKGWEFHMPKFGLKGPKISGPEVTMPDVDVKGPKVEGTDIDLTLSPNKDPKSKDGKEWEFHLPKFGFKSPSDKIRGPDVPEAKPLEGEIDIHGPRLKRGKSEEKDVRTSSSPSKDKESRSFHFTLPRFRLKSKSPKAKLTTSSLSAEAPDIESPEISIKGKKKLKPSDRSATLPAGDIEESVESKTGTLTFGLRSPLRRAKSKSKSPETKKKLDNIEIDIESRIDKPIEVIDLDIRDKRSKSRDRDVQTSSPPTTTDQSSDGKGFDIHLPKFGVKSPEKTSEINVSAGDVDIKTEIEKKDLKPKRSKSKEKEPKDKKKKDDDEKDGDEHKKPKDLDTAFIEAIETLESGSKDRSTGLKFPKLSFKRRDKRDANYDDDSRGKSPTPGKEPTNNDEEKEKKKTRKSKSPKERDVVDQTTKSQDFNEKVPSISTAIYGKFSGKQKIPEGSSGITMPGLGRTDKDKQEFLKAYPPIKSEDADEKIIIRFVLLKSGNNEQPLEEVRLDSTKSEKQIKEAIRSAIQSAISKPLTDQQQTKILARVIRVKSDGEKFLKEYEIDPKNSAVLDDVQQALISTKPTMMMMMKPSESSDDQTEKIILQSLAIKPKNGKEEKIDSIELSARNSDQEIKDILCKLIEKSLPKTTNEADTTVVIIRMIAIKPNGNEKIMEEFRLEPKHSPEETMEKISPKIFKPLRALSIDRKRPNKIIRIILRKPNGDEQVDDLIIDPKTSAKDIDDLIKDSIERKLPQIKKIDTKIITRIIDLKPGEEESMEEFEIQPEIAEKNLDDAIKRAPRIRSSKKKDSYGRIITKIFKRKPDGKESVEEIIEDPKMTGKDIGDDHQFGFPSFRFKLPEFGWQSLDSVEKDVKKPKKIIRIILKTPNGHETIDDQYIDPDTDVKQVEKLLMEKIHSKLSDVPDSQTKIIGKIIDLKPGDKETIEEFELDSDIAKKDLKNVLEQTPRTKTTKQKDPLGRIITKIFRRKPDGKETIEEHLEDPKETGRDIGDDTLGFPSFKIKMPEFGWRSDSVEKDSKKPKKILRIVLRKPDGNEIVDDLLVDPQTSPKDVDRMIKERIKAKLPEIKDSNTMIIGKVIDLKPGDEEKIEEFEADLESAKKNLDDAIKRAPKQKTIKKKDSLGKIITKIFRRKPDGKETIEEFVEDPKQTGKDIGDDIFAQLDKFRTEIPELILHKQIDDPKKPRKIIRVLIQKPNGDESIEDVVVDLKTNPKDVDKILKDLLQKKLPEIKEPNAKIICKIIDLKPGEEETTEEFETDTEMARKNLEDAMKKAPRKKTTKKKDPLGKIITKIFKRKPDGKEMVEEFVEDPKITGREIGDETMGVPDKFKIKKPELFSKSGDDDHDKAKQKQPKKIIRIILRKPNGDEQVEDLHIDPGTSGKDVEKAIKDEIQKKLPQIKDPNMKIISKIIDTKPAPRTKTSKKKDSLGKIITKVFKRKPDGKETVEEFIEDPKVTGKDIGDDDTIGKLPEELKKEMPEVFGKPLENIREKRPKKIIRIILRKPNGDESIEDVEVDHATSPKDVDKAIKDAIQKKLPDIKDPKTQIVSKVIDTKPGEEETTEEFETDPETARKNLDDVMEKAPRKKTTKKKDPLGKIITKIFKRKPDGKETVEEFIEDPKMTGKDIGDDDMPKPISESVTRMTDPTGKTTTRIVREMPDGTKSTQEIIEEPEKKVTTEKLESIERKPEKEKSAATELSKRPKSPKDDPAKQKSAILRKSKSPEKPDVDTKKKKSKKIIRVVLRKPNGEESIEDVAIDQKATPKDVDKAMKDALKRKLSQIKDPKTKIITQIIDSKPGEMESIEEFETDPEIVKKNLNDVLKKAVLTKITKNKDPSGKIRIQIFKRKPDGKEIHEEYVEDPKVTGKDIGDDDTLGKLPDELQKKMSEIMGKFDGKIQEPEKKDEPHHHPEKVKSSIPEVSSKKPDSPKQKSSTLPEMLKSSDVADDEHSKQKKPKKIIRIILRKPNGDEQVEDLLIDADTKPEDKELRKSLNKIDDPVNAKIITKIIDKKPGEEETTEEFETDSESVKKNLDEVMKKAPRTKITKRKDPFGKIITKILRRKPNGEEETVEEFIEDPKQTGKDIGDDDDIDRLRIEPKISTQPAKLEQLFLDPSTRPEDVDDTMKEEIQNAMNKIDDPNTRIIVKIIDSKPGDEESIEEFETDPESLKTNINEAIRKLPRTKTNRKKNQMGKIVTKIFRRKPDGKEEIIDEFVEDPKQTGKDIGDDDIPKPIIESMSKLVDPTGSRPLDSEMAKMPEILKRFDVKEQREKRPKKIIRIILRKPNGDESIEDVEINPATSPKDVDKAIKDAIQKKLPDIKDPKTQIVSKVIDTKPGEEETTEEFETDPETARKNLDDVMEKAPRKKTTKKKDPLGKIITKIFKRKPDGKETVEEFVEDPKVTGKDIGDDAMPKPISESVTRMTDPTGKTTTRIVREMPDGTKSIQEIIEEPEKKDELKPKKMEGRHDEKPSPKDTVDNVLGQFSDQPSKETIRTLEELSKPLPDDIREGEQKSTKTTPTAVMEKPFGSITMSTDHPSQLPSFEPMDTKATTKTSSIDKPTKSATAAPTLISPQKPIIDDNKEQKQVTQSMLPDVEKFADPDKMIIVAEQKEPQIQQKKHAEQTKELPRQSSAITGDDDDEWIKCLQSEIVHEDIEKEKVKKVMETASKPLEKKSVKVVLMKPDGQETMEEVEIDSHTDPRDMNEAVKKVLQKLLPKAKEIPMTKIVARLCRQKSTDECIEEFETDVDNLNNIENFDEIIKNIPKTTIKRIKDPRGNIITRVIKEDPDGTKLIEESIDDPKTPAGHIDPVCEEIIRPKRFVPKFYDDNDEGILNPIVEELPMDEESDKRIFDEPSKKPDMKESSSVKPAPKPEDTKDDNKESETKPIDEKAVPKDLSVSADIKEPQKLVAGVIYDDDDNEEKIEKPIDDIGSSKHSGDITTDQHPEKVETQKADNLIEKDQKSLNDDGSISMKPEKESFIKPDNQTKPGDKTIVTGISTTEKPLNDQTATTAQPDDKKSSNLLKPGDDKISSSELSKKAVDEMMKPSDKPEDQIHLKPMDDVKESTKTKQEKFEEIKVSKSENKKPENWINQKKRLNQPMMIIEIQSKDLISIPSDDESRKKPADDKPTKADEEKPKKPDDKSDNSKSISQPIVETIVADQKPVKDFSKVSSKTGEQILSKTIDHPVVLVSEQTKPTKEQHDDVITKSQISPADTKDIPDTKTEQTTTLDTITEDTHHKPDETKDTPKKSIDSLDKSDQKTDEIKKPLDSEKSEGIAEKSMEKDQHEDETIGEFSIDPKQPEKIANEVMEKAIKPEKAKNDAEKQQKIVLRLIIIRPDGSEQIEDHEVDYEKSDKDIDEIVKDILRQTPKKLKDPKDRPILKILRRKSKQKSTTENILKSPTKQEPDDDKDEHKPKMNEKNLSDKPTISDDDKQPQQSQQQQKDSGGSSKPSDDESLKSSKDEETETIGEFKIDPKQSPEKMAKEIMKKFIKSPKKKMKDTKHDNHQYVFRFLKPDVNNDESLDDEEHYRRNLKIRKIVFKIFRRQKSLKPEIMPEEKEVGKSSIDEQKKPSDVKTKSLDEPKETDKPEQSPIDEVEKPSKDEKSEEMKRQKVVEEIFQPKHVDDTELSLKLPKSLDKPIQELGAILKDNAAKVLDDLLKKSSQIDDKNDEKPIDDQTKKCSPSSTTSDEMQKDSKKSNDEKADFEKVFNESVDALGSVLKTNIGNMLNQFIDTKPEESNKRDVDDNKKQSDDPIKPPVDIGESKPDKISKPEVHDSQKLGDQTKLTDKPSKPENESKKLDQIKPADKVIEPDDKSKLPKDDEQIKLADKIEPKTMVTEPKDEFQKPSDVIIESASKEKDLPVEDLSKSIADEYPSTEQNKLSADDSTKLQKSLPKDEAQVTRDKRLLTEEELKDKDKKPNDQKVDDVAKKPTLPATKLSDTEKSADETKKHHELQSSDIVKESTKLDDQMKPDEIKSSKDKAFKPEDELKRPVDQVQPKDEKKPENESKKIVDQFKTVDMTKPTEEASKPKDEHKKSDDQMKPEDKSESKDKPSKHEDELKKPVDEIKPKDKVSKPEDDSKKTGDQIKPIDMTKSSEKTSEPKDKSKKSDDKVKPGDEVEPKNEMPEDTSKKPDDQIKLDDVAKSKDKKSDFDDKSKKPEEKIEPKENVSELKDELKMPDDQVKPTDNVSQSEDESKKPDSETKQEDKSEPKQELFSSKKDKTDDKKPKKSKEVEPSEKEIKSPQKPIGEIQQTEIPKMEKSESTKPNDVLDEKSDKVEPSDKTKKPDDDVSAFTKFQNPSMMTIKVPIKITDEPSKKPMEKIFEPEDKKLKQSTPEKKPEEKEKPVESSETKDKPIITSDEPKDKTRSSGDTQKQPKTELTDDAKKLVDEIKLKTEEDKKPLDDTKMKPETEVKLMEQLKEPKSDDKKPITVDDEPKKMEPLKTTSTKPEDKTDGTVKPKESKPDDKPENKSEKQKPIVKKPEDNVEAKKPDENKSESKIIIEKSPTDHQSSSKRSIDQCH